MNRHPQPDTAADAPGITSFTDEQLMRVARLFASDESLAAHLDDLPDGGERRRVELASTPHLQMWAISWPAGSTSEWHDHGRATGAFVVVKGALREKRWVRGTTVSAIVEAGESRTFAGDLVHRTAPVGDAPALSVHAYAPSLVGARTYEVVDGSLVEIAAEPRTRQESKWAWRGAASHCRHMMRMSEAAPSRVGPDSLRSRLRPMSGRDRTRVDASRARSSCSST